MEQIRFLIHGDPRTKKNSQIIAGTGRRCPACGKPAKQWIRQSAQHDEWLTNALWQIRSQITKAERGGTLFPIQTPVNVKAVFYMRTHRRVDLLNLLEALDDALVEAGVLEDDRSTIVSAHDGSRVQFDKENPRVEVVISEI